MKQLLQQVNPYYVWHEKQPGKRYYATRCDITYTRVSAGVADFTVTWTVGKGYAESIMTTLDMVDRHAGIRQFGQRMPVNPTPKYEFTKKNFRVWNGSTVAVDPRRLHALAIKLTCVGQPTIHNRTNGSELAYNKTMKSADVLSITGVYPFFNGTHCGRDTDHNVIVLDPGWNDFYIAGASAIKISFDFPFIYR